MWKCNKTNNVDDVNLASSKPSVEYSVFGTDLHNVPIYISQCVITYNQSRRHLTRGLIF